MNHPRDLTTGPVARTLFAFALPALLVNILQSLNGTINAVFVGRLLGETALAATSNANMIMFVVFATLFGFAMSTTILIGQAVGRADVGDVRRITGAAFGLFAAAGIVVGATGWLLAPSILRVMATPDAVFPQALTYLRTTLFGLPVTFIIMLLPSALRGVGDAVTPLWNTVLNVALSAALNPLLIGEFGIAGSALANILAGAISGAFLIYTIYARDLPIRLRGRELRLIFARGADIATLMRLGLPMGLTMIIMSVSALVMIALINRDGLETVAAFGVVNQLWAFLQMPAVAVSSAVSAMAAQNIGANRWDRIDRITIAGIWINVIMTAVLTAALTIWARPIFGLFFPPGSPSVDIAIHINLVVGWTFVLMGIYTVATSVVRANGEMIAPLIILIISAVVLRFAIGFALHPVMGSEAVWLSFIANAVVGMVLSLIYYKKGNWRETRIARPLSIADEPGFP